MNTGGEPLERTEFVLELPSDLGMIEAAVSCLVDRCKIYGYRGPRLNLNFRVGVTEALANAVLYGNHSDPDKSVRVEVSLDASRVKLRVVDQGSGFDPASVPDPTLPDNLLRSGGRGLFLIRQLMDEVDFNERGNSITLVLLRDPPGRRHSAFA